jgi:type IV pilus assembly protein PilN
MIRINLLSEGRRPAAVRKTRGIDLDDRSWTNLALIGAILLGALATLGSWWHLSNVKAGVQEQVVEAEAEVERLRPILAEVEEFKAKKADLERKIEVITNLKNQQRGPVRVMDAISRGLPELLWLERMEVKASQIQLTGKAFNVNAVSNFIENLDKVPEFKEPVLRRVSESDNGQVYQFTISVEYSLASPEPEDEADADADLGEAAAAS